MTEKWIHEILNIAAAAGEAILPFGRHLEQLQISKKSDNTPLSTADLTAHEIIIKALAKLTPDIPVLSEESEVPDFNIRKEWSQYWLVDPLDGTRGFIRGSDEYSVNIALIRNHQSILGVIYAPVTEIFYYAVSGEGAYKKEKAGASIPIHSKSINWQALQVVVGQYHNSKLIQTFIDEFHFVQLHRLNSSLKFGQIAQGIGDVYPRFGPTGEWDTAAGQCIVEEAGGCVVDLNGNPLRYNTKSSLVNPAFVAIGDPAGTTKILNLLPKL